MMRVVGFLLVATTAFAQPDVSQMSGMPLPSGDLPDRTVSVRIVRGSLANNVQGHEVELLVLASPEPRSGKGGRRLQTDANGRAIFNDLPAGATVQAVTTLDGRRLESQSFEVPAKGGIRLVLVGSGPGAGPPSPQGGFGETGKPGILTIGGQSRIIVEQGDGSLEIFYLFDIVNPGSAAVNSGPVTIEMPTGASGASILEGSTPQATAKGPRVIVTAPFQPGTTQVQIAYRLSYRGPSTTVTQTFPIALDQLALIAEKSGDVTLQSPQLSDQREMPVDGRTFIAARGPGIAAGQALTFALTGLPHHSRLPRYLAIAIGLLVLGLGGWAATRRAPDTAVRPSTAATRTGLEKRRERLLEQLVALEQQQRRRAISPDDYIRRREDLIQDLEQVYQALEVTRAA
jgi:hypothetical protein